MYPYNLINILYNHAPIYLYNTYAPIQYFMWYTTVSYAHLKEERKRQLEVNALQAQITPHFIYNTLSRIKWMASIQQADSIAEDVYKRQYPFRMC